MGAPPRQVALLVGGRETGSVGPGHGGPRFRQRDERAPAEPGGTFPTPQV